MSNVLQCSLRNGRPVPVPFKSCGKGVQSEIHHCRDCGREKIRQYRIVLEKRLKTQYDLVLDQLLAVQTLI